MCEYLLDGLAAARSHERRLADGGVAEDCGWGTQADTSAAAFARMLASAALI